MVTRAGRGHHRRTQGSGGLLPHVWPAIRDVLLPRGCAGCDRPDEVLCPDCRALFGGCHERELQGCISGSAYAAAIYQGFARHAILDWKDHDDVELDGPFAEIVTDVLRRSNLPESLAATLKEDTARGPVLVVPAPSSRQSTRRRGRRHLMPLAMALADALCDMGIDAIPARVLASTAGGGRSVQQVSSAQRAQRIGGHIEAVSLPDMPLKGAVTVLVDDIITTGSTLRQCVAALRGAGAIPVGALALAHAVVRYGSEEEDDSYTPVPGTSRGSRMGSTSSTTPQMSGRTPSGVM
ncbi:ComF family protein [Bifidobacterium callitrichidarum]|uniref:ComF family protein n=1 Tax=Bifidobacterium callitrichidarum TaxID=2052941 RepID=A0A2U2N7Y3_9BIFI|nr:ComF family protein [Bifidobacterium callitrichidarum]